LVAAYLATNRLTDAERIVTGALKKNTQDTDAHLQRAEVLLGNGKADEAEEDLMAVMHDEPNAPLGHCWNQQFMRRDGSR
jgi:Tfp pilus assembly protein PilF